MGGEGELSGVGVGGGGERERRGEWRHYSSFTCVHLYLVPTSI